MGIFSSCDTQTFLKFGASQQYAYLLCFSRVFTAFQFNLFSPTQTHQTINTSFYGQKLYSCVVYPCG